MSNVASFQELPLYPINFLTVCKLVSYVWSYFYDLCQCLSPDVSSFFVLRPTCTHFGKWLQMYQLCLQLLGIFYSRSDKTLPLHFVVPLHQTAPLWCPQYCSLAEHLLELNLPTLNSPSLQNDYSLLEQHHRPLADLLTGSSRRSQMLWREQ